MAVVKRIGPGSAFKIGLLLYGIFGVVAAIFVAVFSMMEGTLGSMSQTAGPGGKLFGFGMGLGSIIILPLFYGIFGGVIAAITAVLYNLVAGWVGGLEVDIS